jgi:hypothetical protein
MSRRRKKNRNQQFSSAPSNFPPPQSQSSSVTSNFDAAEDKIRGEELMMQGDLKKTKEVHEVKKALNDQEVDRRLEELRKQLGLRKKE